MSLIPQVTLEISEQWKGKPSCEVLDKDGNYIGTLIIPPVMGGMTVYDNIKTKAEYLGMSSNSVLPPGEVENGWVKHDKYEHLARARAVLKEKREKANASV